MTDTSKGNPAAVSAKEALERSLLALNDWIHTYAPEMCDADDVARSRSRIRNQGGTLAYLADITLEVRQAIAALEEQP